MCSPAAVRMFPRMKYFFLSIALLCIKYIPIELSSALKAYLPTDYALVCRRPFIPVTC